MNRSNADIVDEYGPFPGVEKVAGVTFDGQHVWFASGDKLNALAKDMAKFEGMHLDDEDSKIEKCIELLLSLCNGLEDKER